MLRFQNLLLLQNDITVTLLRGPKTAELMIHISGTTCNACTVRVIFKMSTSIKAILRELVNITLQYTVCQDTDITHRLHKEKLKP